MKKTEWVITLADNMEDELHIEVPSSWLKETLKNWAEQDSKGVENNVETYIEGRTEQLYEYLEEDKYFATEIYNLANEENKILNTREVKI